MFAIHYDNYVSIFCFRINNNERRWTQSALTYIRTDADKHHHQPSVAFTTFLMLIINKDFIAAQPLNENENETEICLHFSL